MKKKATDSLVAITAIVWYVIIFPTLYALVVVLFLIKEGFSLLVSLIRFRIKPKTSE